MLKLALCSALLATTSQAWVPQQQTTHFARMTIHMSNSEESPSTRELAADDPCWQNMLDDDCSMGSVYSGHFVAADWIKSMPCGEGIEDCDMPEELQSPDARAGAGVDNVDVMDVLGLKRAESLSTGKPDVSP